MSYIIYDYQFTQMTLKGAWLKVGVVEFMVSDAAVTRTGYMIDSN